MNRITGGIAVVALAASLHAQAVKNQLLTLTSGARALAVWTRAPKASPGAWYNAYDNTSLVSFDTETGMEKVLDAGPSYHLHPLITPDGQ